MSRNAAEAPSSSEEGVGGGGDVANALRTATTRLATTSDTPRLDAELLMAHALGVSRSELLLRRTGDPAPARFTALVERRFGHEPVAYIVGSQEFYGREFRVEPGVLIPRADSETVIAAALEACPAPRRVLDCGVGSGALLLTVLTERPGAYGVGIDRSSAAIDLAGENAMALELESDWLFALADWSKPGWAEDLGQFDLILANPPYVEDDADLAPSVRDHEPAGALFAGPDGLDDYRLLVPQIPALLAPGGVALFEIGATQAAAVLAIAAEADLTARVHRDLGGRERVVEMRPNG